MTGATGTAAAGGVTITADNTTDSLTVSFSDAVGRHRHSASLPATTRPDLTDHRQPQARRTGRASTTTCSSQIDQLAEDAGFNGVNLLNGDNLEVLFNEDGTCKLDITGVTYNAAGLGLTPLASTAFDTNVSINATLDDLKAGIETLRVQASKFGSNLSVVETRQDFTKYDDQRPRDRCGEPDPRRHATRKPQTSSPCRPASS